MLTEYAPTANRSFTPRWTRGVGLVVEAAGLVGIAVAASVVLSRYPPTLGMVFVAGFGLLGTLALALGRYDAAVGLGILLLAAVRFEPAPADLVIAVVIAVALVTGRLGFGRVPLTIILLLGAFLALNMLASVELIDVTRGVSFFAITLYLAVFGLWLVGYVTSARRARIILSAYVGAAVFAAGTGALALFVAFPGHELLVRGPRAQGLFKDPNVFGPFLVPAALFLMEEAAAPRLLGLRRPVKLLLLSIVAAGILFSFSRGAWLNLMIGTVAMFFVFALRRRGGRRAMLLLVVALASAAVLLAAVVATSSVTFLEERAHFQNYDTQRFGAQLSGIELASRYPLGIGPGQFEKVSDVSAHSTYVRSLTEQGLLGLLVILAVMLLTLGFAGRNAAVGRDTYGIGSAALLAAWCGILANSVFVDTLHWRHLWLVAGLIWAGSARRLDGRPGNHLRPRSTEALSPGRR